MKHYFLALLLFSFAFVLTASAKAIDSNGAYASLGQGSESCGHFIGNLQNDGQYRTKLTPGFYKAWLTGYFTAINVYINDTYSISGSTDIDGAFQWMVRYCSEHPEETFSYAAQVLTKTLRPKRIRNAEDR